MQKWTVRFGFCVCANHIGPPSGNWRPLCSIKECECWMYRLGYTSHQLYLLVLVHQCTWVMALVFVVHREWSRNSIPPPQAMSISYNVLQWSASFPLDLVNPAISPLHADLFTRFFLFCRGGCFDAQIEFCILSMERNVRS